MGTGAANKAVQKWSESDAKKNAAKGLAPSKFDSILGKVGAGAAIGSMFIPGGQLGMFGKAGDAAGKAASVASNTGKMSNFVQGLGGGGTGMMGLLGNTANTFGMNALDQIGGDSGQQPQQQAPQTQSAGIGPSYQPPQFSLGDSIAAGRANARRRYA